MRTLTIYRPKCMEASLSKLIVEIDGEPVGKLANGKDISATIDEKAHELHLHGGKLSGKNFAVKMTIPAGSFSYTFQTNMLDVTSKMGNSDYKPILLPCGNVPKQHASRVMRLMVATLTNALMDEKLRGVLVKIPDVRLRLIIEEQKWGLIAVTQTEQKALLVQPFSQRRGSLLAAATNAIEHGDLKTPEGRAKMIREVFDEYLQYLPDYQVLDGDELALKEK